jgi:protein-S-isoprenylcysteine O-methyltransferase Ste14
VLIPKTKKEIWLNRVRIWLPPVFVVAATALRKPAWNLWGIPLVVLGEALRTWAAGHLVKDESLTVGGPYAHVRNPLYLGSLLNTLGFLVILGDLLLAAIFLALAIAIYLPTVKQEEDYLRRMHGEAFEAYRRTVPGIIPRLTPAKWGACLPVGQERACPERTRRASCPGRFSWPSVFANGEHKTWVALALLFVLLWARGAL